MTDFVVLLAAGEEGGGEPSEPSGDENILVSIDTHIQQLDSHVQELDSRVEEYSNYYDCIPLYVESQSTFDRATLSYLHIFMISLFTVLAIVLCCKIGKWIENLICDR